MNHTRRTVALAAALLVPVSLFAATATAAEPTTTERITALEQRLDQHQNRTGDTHTGTDTERITALEQRLNTHQGQSPTAPAGDTERVAALEARLDQHQGRTPATPTPSTSTTPAPTTTTTAPASQINLVNWKLQLPVDVNGGTDPGCTPAEIKQPALDTYSSEWFKRDATGITFKSPAKGCTTSGSTHTRSELREMNADGTRAVWDAATGDHTMKVRQAVTHLPDTQPRVIAAQIHDADSDVFTVKADKAKGTAAGAVGLCYELGDLAVKGCLDTEYRLGTMYDLEVRVDTGRLTVKYNGATKVDQAFTPTGNYFKAGAYPMSATTDPPAEYGEVKVESLTVAHNTGGGGTPPDTTTTTTPPDTTTTTPPATTTTSSATAPAAQAEPYYLTGYSWYDNTPPGSSQISHPQIHQVAGGTGTYADPITVAVGHSISNGVDTLQIPAGTRFYLVDKQKYLIVEDTCGDGPTPQNGPCWVLPDQYKQQGAKAWIDVWVDGQAAGKSASDQCMDDLSGVTQVIRDPADNLPVRPGSLC